MEEDLEVVDGDEAGVTAEEDGNRMCETLVMLVAPMDVPPFPEEDEVEVIIMAEVLRLYPPFQQQYHYNREDEATAGDFPLSMLLQ